MRVLSIPCVSSGNSQLNFFWGTRFRYKLYIITILRSKNGVSGDGIIPILENHRSVVSYRNLP